MIFTSSPPTKPGFYAWKYKPTSEPESLEVYLRNLEPFARRQGIFTGAPVKDWKGEWCLLLPAEEMEKAFREGATIAYNNRNNSFSPNEYWITSEARKLVEEEW